MRYKLLGLSALLSIAPAYAVTMQSTNGGSGLGLMRTADIMDSGEVGFSLEGQLADYLAVGTVPETLNGTAVPMFSYGMGGWGEMHLTVPYLSASPSGGNRTDGVMDPQLVLKFGTGRPEDGGFSPAFTIFGSLGSGNGTNGIVSGDPNYGVELNLSNWYDGGALHFNIGYEETDSPLRTTVPVRVKKYTAALGAEKALSSSTSIYVESTAYQEVDTSNNNLILSAGFQYVASKDLGVHIGYGQGFPRSRSEPGSILFFGLSYSPNGQERKRYSGFGNMEQLTALEHQNKELAGRVDTLNSKVNGLETQVADIQAAPAPAAPQPMTQSAPLPTSPRVEVINASKNPSVVMRVMDQLQRVGAHVVNVSKAGNAHERKTWIAYREGFSSEAVSLGHQIEGNQLVVMRPLPEGVDIQVVIGDTF